MSGERALHVYMFKVNVFPYCIDEKPLGYHRLKKKGTH